MINKISSKRTYIVFIAFSICMIVLGASDSLRGIFSIVFQDYYELSTTQLSMIVTISYLGNLVFLLCGGNFLDRFNKKYVFISTLSIWIIGALLFIRGNSYISLLLGMFLCTGASTLLNTTINILVPAIFAGAPGLIVNVLFFIQGIGTSGSQNIVGRFAADISYWKMVNIVLLGASLIGMLFMFYSTIPKVEQKKETISYVHIIKNPAFIFYILIFGFYFIAEHGILNWFMLYGINGLELEYDRASFFLSIFFGGITLGRLMFAPLVQMLGVQRSVIVFGLIGGLLYIIGIAGGIKTVVLLSGSGLILSILYPTLVLMIQSYYDKECIASATGVIISIATLFDIIFNLGFGKIVDTLGMRQSFYILQISMLLFLSSLIFFHKKVKVEK
ncbi:MAG: MFS transporter [Clostridiales bacterium]|uniref:MFS transporter n=1 Tax=Zhenhengia yiwuensis TaxID=2763666 RepID=A0A926EIY9_9FIRM|nr:MFS transporter [Zhenhengia yiwuensis]MBC8580439.1 MFS transporter [Zhenhengia yiwuensis]MBS5798814.1 MFS transporter [Clostridiales bacterium]